MSDVVVLVLLLGDLFQFHSVHLGHVVQHVN